LFILSITTESKEKTCITIYNNLGIKIYELLDLEIPGQIEKRINLQPIEPGIYSVIVRASNNQVIRKIVVL